MVEFATYIFQGLKLKERLRVRPDLI